RRVCRSAAAEKGGEMAGDAGIGRIRQAERGEARAAWGLRAIARVDDGEEAFEEDRIDLLAREVGAQRAADELAAARGDRDRMGGRRLDAEQRLLAHAACVGEGVHLPVDELLAVL